MQSEDVCEKKILLNESSSNSEMTFGLFAEPLLPKPEPIYAASSHQDMEHPLDRLKLESCIEKIMPDSPENLTNHDEESISRAETPKLEIHEDSDPLKAFVEQNPNESIRNWLQRITQMQNEIQKKINSDSSSSTFIKSVAETSNTLLNTKDLQSEKKNFFKDSKNSFAEKKMFADAKPLFPVTQKSRIIKYEDLPYMGEMTLDNSKPRRGRKPKKADICHLIYKNYGTIFPGTPESSKEAVESNFNKKIQKEITNKSNVQNKIISSLLEKRLTQETKKSSEVRCILDQNEPLNLCIRDLDQLKIRQMKKKLQIKTESQSDDEVEFINETASLSSQDTADQKLTETVDLKESQAPGGYIYWPNAGVFIHPMALQQHLMYYQRMAANNNYTLPNHSPRPPPEKIEARKLPKIRPKEDKIQSNQNTEHKSKRNASTGSDKTPTKRKRSAIFIPPIPAENQTNPATEVSICKFKFTGGAKPSLQEKKMLSVDSGGNFRYYSGTGDKSMRGYEFFPRETLQQQIESAHGSSTGAFLQASGEKIFPPHDFGKSTILNPDIPASHITVPDLNQRHRKRKTRKSLQREKLEQTFKEKGFLIQTQQLESAEGATYCKFRQLRKFTRYLFRSWKDYLPGNVRELHEQDEEGGDGSLRLEGLTNNVSSST